MMNAVEPTSRADSRGYTLIEVLMAMLILTVGLLGLLQSVNVAYEHNLRNKLREEAVLVAEEQMDVVRRMTLEKNDPYLGYSSVFRDIGGVGKKFNITKESQPIGGDSNRLRVAVRWPFKNVTTTHEIYTLKKM